VEVAHGTKEFYDVPVFPVDVHLFEVSLGETQLIPTIIFVRPIQQYLIAAANALPLDYGTLPVVLDES